MQYCSGRRKFRCDFGSWFFYEDAQRQLDLPRPAFVNHPHRLTIAGA
jgi:hypothetical protein